MPTLKYYYLNAHIKGPYFQQILWEFTEFIIICLHMIICLISDYSGGHVLHESRQHASYCVSMESIMPGVGEHVTHVFELVRC